MIGCIESLLQSQQWIERLSGVTLIALCAYFLAAAGKLGWTDFVSQKLPNRILYPWALATLFGLALAATFAGEWWWWIRAVLAGVAWGGGFFILALLRPGSLGMGDVKLGVVLGMYSGFIGWEVLGIAVMASLVCAGFAAVCVLVFTRAPPGTRMACGPYLLFGTGYALVLG